MSFIDGATTHPVLILSSLELQKVPGKDPAAGSGDEKTAGQPLENDIRGGSRRRPRGLRERPGKPVELVINAYMAEVSR